MTRYDSLPDIPDDSTLRYAVITCGTEWRVVSGRRQIGRFASRAAAMVVAIGLTKQALGEGLVAELLAQGEDGDCVLHSLYPTSAYLAASLL